MKKSEFENELKELGFTESKVNTCNGWGFGGWTGSSYKLTNKSGELEVRLGAEHYRHAPSLKFVELRYDGKRVKDLTQRTRSYDVIISLIEEL